MIEQIPPAQLAAWLQAQAGRKPVVLDVREPWEVQTASVQAAGFDLICIPMGAITARISELDPATPVACLCHHGARSLRVAAFLAGNGFDTVANISGGIHAWSLELDPAIPVY